jgi:hypothetical protein
MNKDRLAPSEDEEKMVESIELLSAFHGTGPNVYGTDVVKVRLHQDAKEYVENTIGCAMFADNTFDKWINGGYYWKFDDSKFDWVRDEEGNPKKIYLTKEQKLKIEKCKRSVNKLLLAKSRMMLLTNRNMEDNHMLNVFANYKNQELNKVTPETENTNFIKKIWGRLSNGSEEDGGD